VLIVLKSERLKLLEPSGPVQPCTGIASCLPFHMILIHSSHTFKTVFLKLILMLSSELLLGFPSRWFSRNSPPKFCMPYYSTPPSHKSDKLKCPRFHCSTTLLDKQHRLHSSLVCNTLCQIDLL